MNKFTIDDIVAAVIVSGVLDAYAMIQSGNDVITRQDIRELASDIKEDVTELDPGFGQVKKDEGHIRLNFLLYDNDFKFVK